jgi:ATP-binding cassette, subfamily C (CFTR/MRP), member 1
VSSVGSIEIAKGIGNRQKTWVDAVQNRIAITSSMLSNIHTIRRMGWSNSLTKIIQERQVRETHLMEGFRWSIVWQNVVQNLPWALGPALTFAVYTSQGKSLDAATTFTNLSIITLLTDPAAKLLSAIPSTSASLGCFDRIQDFLLIPTSQEVSSSDSTHRRSSDANDIPTVGMEMSAFEHRNSYSSHHTTVVTMKDVTILPAASSRDYILQNVNLDVTRSSFVFVIGEVGSGKTSLLRAILGHAVCKGGTIQAPLHDIAYCAQTPWLPNVTIRAAICGLIDGNEVDNEDKIDLNWYQTVLRSCVLDHDLKLLENGDRTQIGSASGAVLSGGQMQRVSLARALYSRKGLLLLDNVFSALDNTTKKHIMARLFGKSGLLQEMKSTVMLVTNDSE